MPFCHLKVVRIEYKKCTGKTNVLPAKTHYVHRVLVTGFQFDRPSTKICIHDNYRISISSLQKSPMKITYRLLQKMTGTYKLNAN